jgi:hypothetical protein
LELDRNMISADTQRIVKRYKGSGIMFATQAVRYYSDEAFMVTRGGRMDMYVRCHNAYWIWAGPVYRNTLFGAMKIPLFVMDDFGTLVQVSSK